MNNLAIQPFNRTDFVNFLRHLYLPEAKACKLLLKLRKKNLIDCNNAGKNWIGRIYHNFRAKNKMFWVQSNGMAFIEDVPTYVDHFGFSYSPEYYFLLITGDEHSLKAILMMEFTPFIPLAYSTSHSMCVEDVKHLLKCIGYMDHPWSIVSTQSVQDVCLKAIDSLEETVNEGREYYENDPFILSPNLFKMEIFSVFLNTLYKMQNILAMKIISTKFQLDPENKCVPILNWLEISDLVEDAGFQASLSTNEHIDFWLVFCRLFRKIGSPSTSSWMELAETVLEKLKNFADLSEFPENYLESQIDSFQDDYSIDDAELMAHFESFMKTFQQCREAGRPWWPMKYADVLTNFWFQPARNVKTSD